MLKVLKVIGKIVFGVIKNIIWLIFALVIALLILWLLTESGSNIYKGVYMIKLTKFQIGCLLAGMFSAGFAFGCIWALFFV